MVFPAWSLSTLSREAEGTLRPNSWGTFNAAQTLRDTSLAFDMAGLPDKDVILFPGHDDGEHNISGYEDNPDLAAMKPLITAESSFTPSMKIIPGLGFSSLAWAKTINLVSHGSMKSSCGLMSSSYAPRSFSYALMSRSGQSEKWIRDIVLEGRSGRPKSTAQTIRAKKAPGGFGMLSLPKAQTRLLMRTLNTSKGSFRGVRSQNPEDPQSARPGC